MRVLSISIAFTVAVALIAIATGVVGVDSAAVTATATAGSPRLRHRNRPSSAAAHHKATAKDSAAEDAIHNARAQRMVDELEAGDSSLLDAMEKSVDERLLSTKKELAEVTNFRKRAMKLLQSKLAALAAGGGDDGSPTGPAAQIRAALAQGKSLSAAYDQSTAGGGDESELTDSVGGGAGGAGGLHSEPINELLSLDAQELEARSALDSETERFQSLRGGASDAEDASEEAAVDSSLDDSISQLKANLTAIQQQRTDLFRHERLHPERLLRVNAAGGAARIDALRMDLEKLRNEMSIGAVYAPPKSASADSDSAAADSAAAFGAKQSLASWIALIEAEIADSAGRHR